MILSLVEWNGNSFQLLSVTARKSQASNETPSSTRQNAQGRRLQQAFNQTTRILPKDTLRILYIVTSGGKLYGGAIQRRFQSRVKPVILETVASLMTPPSIDSTSTTIPQDWMVDVYLVLGYSLAKDEIEALQRQLQAIHPLIQLQVWQRAVPIAYECQSWQASLEDPIGRSVSQCQTLDGKHGPSSQAILDYGKAQLARQHRYVVKDLLGDYDFFLAFEDDMLVKRHHVQYHMEWMQRLERWISVARQQEAAQAANSTWMQSLLQTAKKHATTTDDPWSWQQPLTAAQLEKFRPGWLRVEVLQSSRKVEQNDSDWKVSDTKWAEHVIDPNRCCGRRTGQEAQLSMLLEEDADGGAGNMLRDDQHNDSTSKARNGDNKRPSSNLTSTDLIIWETAILGFGVRRVPDLASGAKDNPWLALMAGPRLRHVLPQYWSGKLLTPEPQRPTTSDPRYFSQSAGWMASRREILEYHTQHCAGGFLPPFEAPRHFQDGYWRNNVEYWSGGIQLWGGTCNIQRFVSLEYNGQDFDKHLLYHSSNNKQFSSKAQQRLVLATTLLAQLQQVQAQGQKELLKT